MRHGCVSVLLKKRWTPNHFCASIKAFYSATLQKFFKKFLFGDTILQDLGIVRLTKTKSYTVSTIKRLAKRFFQIELDSPDSLHLLAQEFTDFLLLLLGITKIVMKWRNYVLGFFWWEVGKIKSLLRELSFANLAKLMAGLLAIPSSNADSERGFSILEKYIRIKVQL